MIKFFRMIFRWGATPTVAGQRGSAALSEAIRFSATLSDRALGSAVTGDLLLGTGTPGNSL